MGKRSDFDRIERDLYPTPFDPVKPLLPFLKANTKFCEPCAGDGVLIDHLVAQGHICDSAFDIEPLADDIQIGDARDLKIDGIDCFITNPPWKRDSKSDQLLHKIIENLSNQHPTWLLFDADWMHTVQAAKLMLRCEMIISVGRVKWFPDSDSTGKDNCCWYKFDVNNEFLPEFVMRKPAGNSQKRK